MTKARARGPKRRAPTKAEGSYVATAGETSQDTRSVGDKFSLPEIKQMPSPRLPETPLKQSPKFSTPSKPSDLELKFSHKIQTLTSEKTEKVKPPTPAKSPLLRATSASDLGNTALAHSPTIRPPPVERALSLPEPSISLSSWQSPGSPVISKTSSRRNGDDLKIETTVRPLPTIPDDLVSPLEAPRSSEDPSQLFGGFFAGSSAKTQRLDLDTMAILSSNRPGPVGDIKTLKTELLEITEHGKLQPVSQRHENMLFDESMYVCLHTFGTVLGTKGKEVYLWSGDKVSESAVEDALLFARKMARDNDGKLVRPFSKVN